jgi:ferrous iron transport protein B
LSTQHINIALVGNPNSGKSSLFNALTGLQQKVGNFSGVTVEKYSGAVQVNTQLKATVMDLPGTYSFYPKGADEEVSYTTLLNTQASDKPNLIIAIADASNLKRNLLFCTQILDLQLPTVIALTMTDIAAKKGIEIDVLELSRQLGVAVVSINPLKGRGLKELLKQVSNTWHNRYGYTPQQMFDAQATAPAVIDAVQQIVPTASLYACLHLAIKPIGLLNTVQQAHLETIKQQTQFNITRIQAGEILQRYKAINNILKHSVAQEDPLKKELRTERIDKVLLHPVWGNIILLLVLFVLFQSVYWLASYPMDWIDQGYGQLTQYIAHLLPQNAITHLLVNGLLAGLGGILVFIPQIAILFGLITILEDSGYMARISFLSDRLMRSVGLNGKAVLPLISGIACAVPAIMSTRTIENPKEKLIALLVTPLMSCSARLPIYTIIISLVIPNNKYLGFISLQGLVLMGMYVFGFVMTLLASKVLSLFIKAKGKSIFLMELPIYRQVRWANVGTTMLNKVKVFVTDAGKVIIIISILLWGLCNYGPGNTIDSIHKDSTLNEAQKSTLVLQASYAGKFGQAIEPALLPLGFDWKIGIALLTSFAAREVFVGTMATLYSVEAETDDNTLLQKLKSATNKNGTPTYTLATGLSLMIFYAIALQCMSTLATVYRETKKWQYPIAQFIILGVLAYTLSWLTYTIANACL